MKAELQQLKDHTSEARVFSGRVALVSLFCLLLLIVVAVRYYTLQVINHQDYVTQSDRNRIQAQPIAPTRGLIYDRNGRILADNRPSYTLSVVKERVPDLEAALTLVGSLISVSDNDLERFDKALQQRRRPYQSIPLRYRLSEEEIALLAVNEYRLPGVEVEAQLVRYYPYKELFAHVLGYVGRINDVELNNFSEEEYERYEGTFTIGKVGLERYYEDTLLGQVGSQNVEINARGRVLKTLARQDPSPGRDLRLYLDVAVQQAAYDALGGQRGAVVAIDPRNGGVVAMVSTPSFDPNLFVTGISYKDYNDLNTSLDKPLFDRVLQGQYPPGSTLKPLLGLGGLQSQTIDASTQVRDPGFFRLPNQDRVYRDWKRGGHGQAVDLNQAIVESCNTFFYTLANRMGIDTIHAFGAQFGLGSRTGLDLPSEKSGIWPSREWKRNTQGVAWYPGDSINVGVGQGYVLLTPVQLAVMTATIAARGIRYEPQIVQPEGDLTLPLNRVDMADEQWDYVLKAMEEVVHGRRGTAKAINKGMAYRMGGKTGTAQIVGMAQNEEYDIESVDKRQRDQALFISFAPVDNPSIAVAVVIENGEHGSAAAPVARQVIDAYFESERARAEIDD